MPQPQTKLKFHFHNANTTDEMIAYILPIMMDANASKIQQAIQNYADHPTKSPSDFSKKF